MAIHFSFCSLFGCKMQQEIVRRGISRKGLFARMKFYDTECLFSPYLFMFTYAAKVSCAVFSTALILTKSIRKYGAL